MNEFLSNLSTERKDKCSMVASSNDTLEIIKKGTKVEIIPVPRKNTRHTPDENSQREEYSMKPMRLSISSEMSVDKPQVQDVHFISALKKHSESDFSEEPSLIRQISTISLLDLSSDSPRPSASETHTLSLLNLSSHPQQIYCKHCKRHVYSYVKYKQPTVSLWKKIFCNYCYYHKKSFVAFHTCRDCGLVLSKRSCDK